MQDNYWEQYLDPISEKNYYHNPSTKETVWELPKDAKVAKMAAPQPKEGKKKKKRVNKEV
jgi:hypothetical protein